MWQLKTTLPSSQSSKKREIFSPDWSCSTTFRSKLSTLCSHRSGKFLRVLWQSLEVRRNCGIVNYKSRLCFALLDARRSFGLLPHRDDRFAPSGIVCDWTLSFLSSTFKRSEKSKTVSLILKKVADHPCDLSPCHEKRFSTPTSRNLRVTLLCLRRSELPRATSLRKCISQTLKWLKESHASNSSVSASFFFVPVSS